MFVTSPRFTYLGPNLFYAQQIRNAMFCIIAVTVTDTFSFIFFKFLLSLKLAGLCYHVKVLKYISFSVLCFCFELVTYDNSDMAI